MEHDKCHHLSLATNRSFSNYSFNMSELKNCDVMQNKPQMPEIPMYLLTTTTFLYIIIFISGTVGNVLVIAAVSLERSIRSSTNLFLVNLAVADLMVILIAMPTALTEVFAKDEWYFGNVMCKLVPILENSVAHASVLTMMAIAVERFQAICHPLELRYNKIYSRSIKLATVSVLWVVAILCSTPFVEIAIYKDSHHVDGTPIKVCRQYIIFFWQKAYVVGLFVAFYVLPLTTTAVLYAVIIKKLKEKVNTSDKDDKSRQAQDKARRKVIVMIVVVTVLLFVLHSPLRIAGMWMTFADPNEIRSLGFEGFWNLICFVRVMFYVNSCLNPIVYSVMSTKFRRGFRRVPACCSSQGNVNRQSSVVSVTQHVYTRVHSIGERHVFKRITSSERLHMHYIV